MKKIYQRANKAWSLLLAVVLVLSMAVTPAMAVTSAPTGSTGATFTNTTEDGGEDAVSLTDARTFQALIPVSLNEADAQAAVDSGSITWDLSRTTAYLNTEMFPNWQKGGPLDQWTDSEGNPYFQDMKTEVVAREGKVYLQLTFSTGLYYADASFPHGSGAQTGMDVIGWYSLSAKNGNSSLGSVAVHVNPYDSFHTMDEVYTAINEIAAAETDLYVEKFSMGKSQAGFDMPYLIVAKDQAAVDKWLRIKAQAEADPDSLLADLKSGGMGEYQVPVLYSNVHSNETSATDSILKFAKMLVENETISYEVLTGFTDAGKEELASQFGPVGQSGSLAVPDLVKETSTYLGFIKGKTAAGEISEISGPVDLDTYYTSDTEAVSIKDLLDDVFFILVPEENVEGRMYMTRTSSGGFDLNRDNSFQTQAETQNMTRLIASWNPVSFAELHGRVKSFQCEPCDPPHEPNFEYGLLAEHLMTGGEAFGIAAVANNESFNSYVIPQRDYLEYTGKTTADGAYETYWSDPWDDMSTSYTPQYSMLHGTVAYTVECPAYNEDSTTALAYGQLGQSVYVAHNKDAYLTNQARIFQRGVTNANSNAYDLVGQWFCNQYDVEGAEADLFRPVYDGEGQNGNFYPECYILPVDGENQSNLQAAYEMAEWLTRNGVQVSVTHSSFTYDGVTYPAGTLVVSMYQAKRSVANGVLYDGTLITDWTVLYSEGITAFSQTRGFDLAVCAEPAAYRTIAAACGTALDYEACLTWKEGAASSFTGETGGQVLISNASEDSTAAINALLQSGKTVAMVTAGPDLGSFLCSYADWQAVSSRYLLTGTGLTSGFPRSQVLSKAPVVYISGVPAPDAKGYVKFTATASSYQYNYDRQAMERLGFQVTNDASKADVILGASALDAAALAAVRTGTPYIGYGSKAVASVTKELLPSLKLETVSEYSMDALIHVTYPTVSMTTSSYMAEGDDILYGYGAGYFAEIPTNAQILARLDSTKEVLEGFLCGDGEHYGDFLNNSIQAIAYTGGGKNGAKLDCVLFANTLTNKVHQRDEFNFISNFAFYKVMGEVHTTGADLTADQYKQVAEAQYTDLNAESWCAEAVGQLASAGLMNGTDYHTFNASGTLTRGMLVSLLYRLAGATAVEGAVASYQDVPAGSWCADAVYWAKENGIVAGYHETTFGANDPVTREQAVAILYRYAQSMNKGLVGAHMINLSQYTDLDQVADWAMEAFTWAKIHGVMNGTTETTLSPKGNVNRAEAAVLLVRTAEALQA